jgi:hypothetical protein
MLKLFNEQFLAQVQTVANSSLKRPSVNINRNVQYI